MFHVRHDSVEAEAMPIEGEAVITNHSVEATVRMPTLPVEDAAFTFGRRD